MLAENQNVRDGKWELALKGNGAILSYHIMDPWEVFRFSRISGFSKAKIGSVRTATTGRWGDYFQVITQTRPLPAMKEKVILLDSFLRRGFSALPIFASSFHRHQFWV